MFIYVSDYNSNVLLFNIMMNEVTSAVNFLSNILKTNSICSEKTDLFKRYLQNLLVSHYRNHWFPDKPNKGSGYRCLRMNHKMDPLIKQAGEKCGFTEEEIFSLFPRELTVWIDPHDVSYRIGENGSIGILYRGTTSPEQCSSNNTAATTPESKGAGLLSSCKEQLMNSLPIPGDSMKHLATCVFS